VVSQRSKFEIKSLPQYLFLVIKRFSKNNFFKEKNCTIVNFPLSGLDLTELSKQEADVYDLVGNVVHEGNALTGSYKCQVMHPASKEWF
jgi:U4/U6.U5 tri-snRNP-associated protein 2